MITENYCVALTVLDRLEAQINKPGNMPHVVARKMGMDMNKFKSMFNSFNIPRVKNLAKWAQALNVSYEWVLTGKNYGEYEPINIDLKGLVREYEKNIKRPENGRLLRILENIKQNKIDDISITLLLDFEDWLKKPAFQMIKDDK